MTSINDADGVTSGTTGEVSTGENSSTPIETINIDPQGDLILRVGSVDDNTLLRLRVDSYILRKASKAFRVLLGPDFKEGQELQHATANNPLELALPEDHAEAMKVICQALHLQQIVWPEDENVQEELALGFSSMADKYFLQKPLAAATENWFNKIFEDRQKPVHCPCTWLITAKDLDNPPAFEKITRHILQYFPPSQYENLLGAADYNEVLLWKLLYSLTKISSKIRMTLTQHLHDYMSSFSEPQPCDPECECYTRLPEPWYSMANSPQLKATLMHRAPLCDILPTLEEVFGLIPQSTCIIHAPTPAYERYNLKLLPGLFSRHPGLCIDCLNSKESVASEKCRDHPVQEEIDDETLQNDGK